MSEQEFIEVLELVLFADFGLVVWACLCAFVFSFSGS